jgi:hypothetical protein
MRRRLLIGLATLGVLAVGAYAFREPLLAFAIDRLTAHMFVARDDDAFDPGIATGEPFPAIRARIGGRELTRLDEFSGEKGLAVFVNRSVDW